MVLTRYLDNLKIKVTDNEKINRRMDQRLKILEKEMIRSTNLKKQSEKLRSNLTDQVELVNRENEGLDAPAIEATENVVTLKE